jgi:hypothetical protein
MNNFLKLKIEFAFIFIGKKIKENKLDVIEKCIKFKCRTYLIKDALSILEYTNNSTDDEEDFRSKHFKIIYSFEYGVLNELM